MSEKVDVTDLGDDALIVLCPEKLFIKTLIGCGFNSLQVLKQEFVFTPKQFVTFQMWLKYES